jgi:hypothetical protein
MARIARVVPGLSASKRLRTLLDFYGRPVDRFKCIPQKICQVSVEMRESHNRLEKGKHRPHRGKMLDPLVSLGLLVPLACRFAFGPEYLTCSWSHSRQIVQGTLPISIRPVCIVVRPRVVFDPHCADLPGMPLLNPCVTCTGRRNSSRAGFRSFPYRGKSFVGSAVSILVCAGKFSQPVRPWGKVS